MLTGTRTASNLNAHMAHIRNMEVALAAHVEEIKKLKTLNRIQEGEVMKLQIQSM
jgi:hypothetical protein